MAVVRFLGNVVWFVVAGWWLALAYLAAAILMFLLVITIPFGVQALKLAGFALWPYGRTVVGIPFGIASFKMVPLAIWPFGRIVVSVAEADRLHQPMGVRIGPTQRA